jgi:hypothetical protein
MYENIYNGNCYYFVYLQQMMARKSIIISDLSPLVQIKEVIQKLKVINSFRFNSL